MEIQKQSSKFINPLDLIDSAIDVMEGSAPVPASIMSRDHALEELLEIMTDLVAVRALEPAPASFAIAGNRLVQSTLSFAAPAVAFRSGSSVVHSDVVPLEMDFIVVELEARDSGFRLTLEQGQKKEASIPISLYRSGNLMESLLIKGRIHRDLDSLGPGAYSLVSGETRLLNFNILDENKDNHPGRSYNSKN